MDYDTIKEKLGAGACTVVFTVKDGEQRTFNRCTIKESLIPAEHFPFNRTPREGWHTNPKVLSVWDLDAASWNGFNMDNVVSVTEIAE